MESAGKDILRPESRAASLPSWVDAELTASKTAGDHHIGPRERTSLPGSPTPPVLLPAQSTVFYDASSLTSWRLSLSTDKLDDLFTPDTKLSLFQPIAKSPASSSMTDLKQPEFPIRQRSKSSPLTIRDANTANKLNSRQDSPESTIRNRIPASESLARDESPVGLWLRTQNIQFHSSTTSPPLPSEHEAEHHQVTIHQPETQTQTDRACQQSGLRPSSRWSGPAIKVGSNAFHHPQKIAVHIPPVPAYRCNDQPIASRPEAHTETLDIVPAAGSPARGSHIKPLQILPRKSFGGLRLPSFKCEFPPLSS